MLSSEFLKNLNKRKKKLSTKVSVVSLDIKSKQVMKTIMSLIVVVLISSCMSTNGCIGGADHNTIKHFPHHVIQVYKAYQYYFKGERKVIGLGIIYTQANTEIRRRDAGISSRSLNKLKKIKELKTGKKDAECFCSNVRRRVWFKDFMSWFESNS